MNKTIAITGANGYLGNSLVTHFRSKSWKVKALVRNMPVDFFEEVTYCNYEMKSELNEFDFDGVDFVVHAAYVKNEVDKNSDEINIEATKRLINLCKKRKIKLVFLSSFSAHKVAVSHYGKHKLACEKLFDLQKDVVLKIGFVIGDKGILAEIVKRIKNSSFFPLIGGGQQPLQTICIKDFNLSVEKVLLDKDLVGSFNLAHEEVIAMEVFYKYIANLLGAKVSFINVPTSLLLIACLFFEKLGVKLPVSSENVLGLKKLTTFNTSRTQNDLGIWFKGYKESLSKVLTN
ncbi:NAD-dependent epimerase/dehydratase family protein [Aquimarina agarilytica]|uniref:NAD-dependent epimerase/dehydratase family protein n=1 Tax=Aquimarina agarilytica TaxID=1087449 RepID=UPI0002888208|nr:NAD-dependent epimerase/dehydratase family protein [Aquimarina agarilytica]